jgi:membrane protein implicated in regulation of membrane protease activity
MPPFLMFSLALVLTLGVAQDAFAYIGPGAGLSMIGAFWALLVAVFAALSFLILWPIRRVFARRQGKPQTGSQDSATQS